MPLTGGIQVTLLGCSVWRPLIALEQAARHALPLRATCCISALSFVARRLSFAICFGMNNGAPWIL